MGLRIEDGDHHYDKLEKTKKEFQRIDEGIVYFVLMKKIKKALFWLSILVSFSSLFSSERTTVK